MEEQKQEQEQEQEHNMHCFTESPIITLTIGCSTI
jgi:hypothetical protein